MMKIEVTKALLSFLVLHFMHTLIEAQRIKNQKQENVVAEMQVLCRSDSIVLKLNTNTPFDGMVYAKDAPTSRDCMTSFASSTNMTFRLPLKSCNTLFAEVDDGIEYFNTVVVQPHMRLMTNQGKGYHVRCKYQTRERTIANTHFNVSASFMMQNNPQTAATPLLATASMPSCTMKIFRSGRDDVAETVKIGDKLIMVIEIDQQDMYGMKITNCLVRDGMDTAAQQLIDDVGCPVDEAIMPRFEYTNNSTRAAVSFPAHKFPHTSSVYYQCNVRLCINNGGCQQSECNNTLLHNNNNNYNNSANPRKKRFASGHEASFNNRGEDMMSSKETISGYSSPSATQVLPEPSPLTANLPSKDKASDMSFDVYSGLYVNDIEVGESGSSDRNTQQVTWPRGINGLDASEEICLSVGQMSLMILLACVMTIGLSLLLVCQIGLLGSGSRHPVSGSRKMLASHYPENGQQQQQQCNHESNRSRHYHYDTETLS